MPRCIVVGVIVAALIFADGASVISHRVHVLRPARCARTARVRRGHDVSMRLSAWRAGGEELAMSNGFAEQRHVVGKHPIPPIDKALVGMCKGEQRQVSVYWDGEPGVQYFVELVDILSGPRRLKPLTDL